MDQTPLLEAPSARRRSWRWVWWVLAPFALVILLLAEENLRGRWMLHQVHQSMKAEGARTTLAALGLPAPVPADNAAPEVLAAAAELSKLADENRLVSFGPRGLMKPAEPGRASCAYREARFPSANGFRSPNQESAKGSDDWLLATVQLHAAQAPLDRLRAALARPVLVLPSNDSLHPPMYGDLEHAHGWLRSHALCSLHGGDLDAAIDDILACCSMARLQRTDLHLISQKSAETTDAFVTELIWEALQAGGWDDARLARLQAGAHNGEQVASALRSFEVQRALVPMYFENARKSTAGRATAFRLGALDLLGEEDRPAASEWGVQLHSFLWWAAWSHNDEARALTLWRAFLASARAVGSDHSWIKFNAEYPRMRAEPGGFSQWRQSFSDIIGPASAWYVLSSLTRSETERQMALTAIALKRWTLREHTPPPSLDALVPKLLGRLPIDFMDGQPLRYQLSVDGESDVLYSIGLDGKDNGGDPATTATNGRVRSIWAGRDAMWPALTIAAAGKER